MYRLYLHTPAYRSYLKGLREQGLVLQGMDEYLGNNLYVSRKPIGPGRFFA